MKIGQVIRKIRKEKGATLEEIALMAGTDPANLSRVERDMQQLTPEMLENVARALDMPVSALYLIAEQTAAHYHVKSGKDDSTAKAGQRLDEFVTQFMLLSATNQQLINEFIKAMLKVQEK